MSDPVILTGPRLVLREFTEADVPALHAIYSDPVTTEHLSFGARNLEQVGTTVEGIIAAASAQPRVDYSLAVCLAEPDGELIGMGRIARGAPNPDGPTAGLDPDSASAQFGLAIRADRWHRGYGREALDLLIGLAFDSLTAQEVWGARGPANQASKKLMDNRGFTEAFTIPDHITKNGTPRDSIVHILPKAARFR